jgi:hypothetical protein
LIHIPGPYLIGRGGSGVIGNLGFRVRLVRGGDTLLAFACTIRLILSISRRFSLFILGLDSTLFHVQDVAFLGFLWRITLISSCYFLCVGLQLFRGQFFSFVWSLPWF